MERARRRPPPWVGLLAGCVVLVAAAASTASAAEQRERTASGRVVVARGHPIAVDVRGAVELVSPAPGASLVGFGDPYELWPGDRVRFTWRREASKVKLAEVIEADPIVAGDPALGVGADELAESLLAGNARIILDARPESRFEAGHLPGARLVSPRGDVGRALGAVDPDSPIVVYGESPRTGEGWALARRLLASGLRNVHVLRGGFRRWVSRDRPLEIAPRAAAASLRRPPGWLVVDVRPAAQAAEGRIPGSVSSETFRSKDFDGLTPLFPVLLVGADAEDRAPFVRAEQIRKFRSQSEVKPPLRLTVLAGGLAAWRRAGLPVEAGGQPETAVRYRPLAGEISPEEFARGWLEEGSRLTYLDVRRSSPAPEWVVRIPLEDLAARLGEISRDREVVVFCMVGERARVAAEMLRQNGYRTRYLRAGSGH